MQSLNLTQLPPLSLYIHIPWCVKKCPYCDFNSHTFKNSQLPEMQYVDCLIADLEPSLPLIWGRQINTIFIGGGTPSLFSGEAINRLINELRMRLRISPYAEITMEANPGTVESKYIKEYRDAGINRLSVGIQSFNDVHLQKLGRIHSASEAEKAIENVAKHFDNFNLDIIYGLPEQSIEQAKSDIEKAISLNPTHISAYNLTIEPNTEFAKFVPKNLPSEDLCYQMQDEIVLTLSNAGYSRYEVSAYAKENRQAQHNLNYWQFGDYLGIGAGAHSKLSFHDKIIRQARIKHPEQYMKSVAMNQHIQVNNVVEHNDLPFEFMMNALRLVDGFNLTLFNQATGLPISMVLSKITQLQQQDLVVIQGNHLKPTNQGMDYLNNMLEIFLN